MPGAISALASWTLAGCRPANVAGSSMQVSVTCGSPTGPTASIWTASTPAECRLHPERGGNHRARCRHRRSKRFPWPAERRWPQRRPA